MTTNTTQTRHRDILNNLFRSLLEYHGMTEPKSYEWLDGEAWYQGEPIASRLTENESKAVAHMIYIITH